MTNKKTGPIMPMKDGPATPLSGTPWKSPPHPWLSPSRYGYDPKEALISGNRLPVPHSKCSQNC